MIQSLTFPGTKQSKPEKILAVRLHNLKYLFAEICLEQQYTAVVQDLYWQFSYSQVNKGEQQFKTHDIHLRPYFS